MKHFLFYPIAILLFLSQTTVSAQISRKVLFLGNSYTYVNNLPQLIADAALSVGDTLIFDSHTPGGYKLVQHSADAISQSKIAAGGWDYVVLQGQSQEPITDENNFYTGAVNLKNQIKQYNPCAVPLLYMTWGRKNGDALNCPNIPVMCTYEGMDTTIKRDYLTIADWYRMEVSPVSVVWKYLRNNHPNINLYLADESHPSAEGSYAAACCFYAAIFKKNPALITYNFGLNAADAAIIRNAAKINVYDSLSLWDYKKLPVSEFSYVIGSGVNQVVFNNTSQNADSYLWNFGDGTNSALHSPTHSYAANGTYTVSLTTSNCDLQGLHTSIMDTVISFCNHSPVISPDTLMLCPSQGDTLWTQPGSSYQWYSNGILIPGATQQYLVVTRTINVLDYPNPSVLTTNAGCAELSKQSFVGQINWTGMLLLGFNAEGNLMNGDSVCEGETIKLITLVFENHITQWYKNGSPIPLGNSDTLTTNTSGFYKVKIIHPLCPEIASYSDSVYYKFVSCTVGLTENNRSLFEGVYPSPASDILIIKLKDKTINDRLQIFNVMGVLVKEVEATETTRVDVSDLPKGLYFIRLKNQKEAQKFVKE